MVYNGILMETIVISVMFFFLASTVFFSIKSTNGRIHFKVDTMKSLQHKI